MRNGRILSVTSKEGGRMKRNDYVVKDSGDRRKFDTGAHRDMAKSKGRFDLIPPETLRALAIHYEKGAQKYEARNWEKGLPVSSFIDSGFRHLIDFLEGRDDENHLIASIWNLFCAYATIIRVQRAELKKELYDLPHIVVLPDPINKKK